LEDIPVSGLTSVGLSMPVAFNVSNSPLTSDGTIAVSGAGTASQYIRGDGQLATLPSGGGGGSSVNYYLNGSINASVATYKQLSNTAVIGTGTDFTKTGNGLISQFLTDLGNPNRTEIPAGAWNFEMFFSMSSNGGTPAFYVELLKYDGATFTSIASSSAVPENISGGTSIDLYLSSLAVPTTLLLVTDRLAIRVYIVNNSGGRTATLHTENSHLCEIITTFSGGVTSLNGLTTNTQYLAVGTTGTDFNINSLVDTHTFNLPTASATNRGALSTTDWSSFNGKFTLPALTSGSVLFSNGTTIAQDNANFFWDDTNNRLGIGTNAPFSGSTGAATGLDIGIFNSAGNEGNLMVRGYSSLGGISRGGYGAVGSNYYLDSSNALKRRFGDRVSIIEFASGGFIFNNAANGTAGSTISLTELMRLNLSGNLLINTTTDNGGKLQIKAPGALSTDIALRVRNSADTFDIIKANGAGDVYIGVAAGRVSTGTNNSFFGAVAGYSNTTGNDNTFVGNSVGANNNTGIANTFLGSYTAYQNTTGNNNTAIGFQAARFISNGVTAASIISNSVFVGRNAYPLANNQTNQIVIGDSAIGIGSNSVVLGNDSIVTTALKGNVGIGTTAPVASAKVQVDSTTQGFLPPRMTNAQRLAIATPAIGLMVYCTDTIEGLYINKSTGWTFII
jgi:hypothetical protein